MFDRDPDCLFCKIVTSEIPSDRVLETDAWSMLSGRHEVQFWREPLSDLCAAATDSGAGGPPHSLAGTQRWCSCPRQ